MEFALREAAAGIMGLKNPDNGGIGVYNEDGA